MPCASECDAEVYAPNPEIARHMDRGNETGTDFQLFSSLFVAPPQLHILSLLLTQVACRSPRGSRPRLSCTPSQASHSCKINWSSGSLKRHFYFTDADDFDREEIATYEEVARLFPRAGTFRPIVLVGPPGVGRNEIKRRIIAMEPDRFRVTIPRKANQKAIYIGNPDNAVL